MFGRGPRNAKLNHVSNAEIWLCGVIRIHVYRAYIIDRNGLSHHHPCLVLPSISKPKSHTKQNKLNCAFGAEAKRTWRQRRWVCYSMRTFDLIVQLSSARRTWNRCTDPHNDHNDLFLNAHNVCKIAFRSKSPTTSSWFRIRFESAISIKTLFLAEINWDPSTGTSFSHKHTHHAPYLCWQPQAHHTLSSGLFNFNYDLIQTSQHPRQGRRINANVSCAFIKLKQQLRK